MIRQTKYQTKPNSRCYTSSPFRLKQTWSKKHSSSQLSHPWKKTTLVFRIVHTFVQRKIQYQFDRQPPVSLRAMGWDYEYIHVKLYLRDLPVLIVLVSHCTRERVIHPHHSGWSKNEARNIVLHNYLILGKSKIGVSNCSYFCARKNPIPIS